MNSKIKGYLATAAVVLAVMYALNKVPALKPVKDFVTV